MEATQRKKWFRNPPIIISILALTLSLLSTVYSAVKENQSFLRNQREELRSMLIGTIDIEAKARSKLEDPADGEIGYSDESKIDILLSAIDAIEATIPGELSFHEYQTLSDMHGVYGDRHKVHYYDQRMVDSAGERGQRAFALRMSASSYLIFGNMDQALERLRGAIDALEVIEFDAERNELANVYIDLARFHLELKEEEPAVSAIQLAQEHIELIESPTWKKEREQELASVINLISE